MKEGEAAPIRGLQAPTQILPAPDPMHCLIAYDAFEDIGRGRPIDRTQHEKAAIEPRGEQMDKILVDRPQSWLGRHKTQQFLADPDQRRSSSWRQIEPTHEFLP